MSRFSIISNADCVLNDNGVFKPADLYSYQGYIHAKLGSGYVRLYRESFGVRSTSKPKVRWDRVSVPAGVTYCSTTGGMKEVT